MKPRFYGRQQGWNYEKAVKYNDRVDGILYLSELAGPNGAHYHLFVDRNTTIHYLTTVLLPKFQAHGDVVSWSYNFIPEVPKKDEREEV
jgi:hypothetical protein